MATPAKRVTKAERKRLRYAHLLNSLTAKIQENGAPVLTDIGEVLDWLLVRSESLRKRFEAECSYEWANKPSYLAGTERLEKQIVDRVKECGLHAFIHGDCRGASLYVDSKPIPPDNYTQAICVCLD